MGEFLQLDEIFLELKKNENIMIIGIFWSSFEIKIMKLTTSSHLN